METSACLPVRFQCHKRCFYGTLTEWVNTRISLSQLLKAVVRKVLLWRCRLSLWRLRHRMRTVICFFCHSWKQSAACHPSGCTSGKKRTHRLCPDTLCWSVRGHRCVCTELTWNTHGEPPSASLVPLPRQCQRPVNHRAPPTHKSAAKTTHQRPLRDRRKAGAGPPDSDSL